MSRLRVFLADDHPDVLEKVTSLLSHVYEIVGTATDGQAVIEKVQRLKPDVLVLDISMPIMSGIESAERLRKSGLALTVVFLTVHADPDFLRAAMAAGGLGYVLKARLATDLIPSIEAALAGRTFISSFPAARK